jgi:lantibiotic modifying enzyme
VSGSGKWLAQWCHGAPGVVTSLRPFPVHYSNRVEQKLVEAGNLIWRAGPLVKGPSLCHGTAGNGYAFLQLFERSGDQLWLDRARSFAMHTIEQIARRRAKYHSHHFSLFTGDYGAAWFLSDCLHLRVDFPLLESIE